MKFGIRECANIVFRAKKKEKIGASTFEPGQPVLYIDTATTSSIEQASSTVYAQGGRGNSRLIAWEGDKTLTFTVEDALLSPIGFAILSGAQLFKESGAGANGKVHFHMTSMATLKTDGTIDLKDAVAPYPDAEICLTDAPLFVMGVDDDGSIDGTIYKSDSAAVSENVITLSGTITPAITESVNVMVDYYIDLPGQQVYEADITADTFAGYYYVEADTLFRQQSTGKDLPANLTFPNVKIQSNFTITMAGTGDPSAFTFTMDAFPGYTYFDKTKKVLCVMQIMDNINAAEGGSKPVMDHNDTIEHNSAKDIVDMDKDSLGNYPAHSSTANIGG